MRRAALILLAIALMRCGGDAVDFDMDHPPRALRNIDRLLPSKALQARELSNCIGIPFRTCTAEVMPSRSMMRKGRFVANGEVRITYTPNEKANEVVVTARPEATVPVRKSGGRMSFECRGGGPNGCVMELQ